MHTGSTIANGRRAHWRNHYQREVDRIKDELRNAHARLRTWQLRAPDSPENPAHQEHIESLRALLNKFRTDLARWSDPA